MITSKILPESNLRFLSYPAIARAPWKNYESHPQKDFLCVTSLWQGSTVQNCSDQSSNKILQIEPDQEQKICLA